MGTETKKTKMNEMKMTDIQNRLFKLADKEYGTFQGALIPGVESGSIIGVRVPQVRDYAKELVKTGKYEDFLTQLPHRYYDENILHGSIIACIKDYDTCIGEIDRFLPYVDNWAVCDTITPKVLSKHKGELMKEIKRWTSSLHTYTCRFGIRMIMCFFLDDDFREEYLDIPAGIRSDEYYVNMMIAWFFATALAKQWDSTIPYIENHILPEWVHNKTIQKARESFRITPEQKEYLKGLKV